jgi:hypothetical protein
MKKTLFCFCLLFCSLNIFAQQFSQYNTETLFDAFENPAQRSFIRDSSNSVAFNFFVPNFGINGYLKGNAELSLRSRLFDGPYDNTALQIGQGKLNHANVNTGIYFIMFKIYSSMKGDQELGFSFKTKGEGRAAITDETMAMLNGKDNFDVDRPYNDIFNSNGYYQTYHQLGFSYREKVSNRVAVGMKFNILLGISYQKLDIHHSGIQFQEDGNKAILNLDATYKRSYVAGKLSGRDAIPSFRNPGASITLGTVYKNEHGTTWQFNVKDLGFIKWSGQSQTYNVLNSTQLTDLRQPTREDSVKAQVSRLLNGGIPKIAGFVTPTNAIAEIGASKRYWLNDNHTLKLSPSVVVQKELFNPGFTGALLGHLQYNNLVFTASTSYNERNLFSVGAQGMYKTANVEFYLGTEALLQSKTIVFREIRPSPGYSGGSVFMGFSVKLGRPIESPLNASHIPMGEKGFLVRLWNRWFKSTK